MAHESSSEEYKKKVGVFDARGRDDQTRSKGYRSEREKVESEAYMKEKMRLYLSGPQYSERFWANMRGRDAMLEWEAEDAKREEMEIAKAAMEKYLKGMQYSERFWVNARKSTTHTCFNNSFNNKQSSKSSRRKKV